MGSLWCLISSFSWGVSLGLQVPDCFLEIAALTLKEFFRAVLAGKDSDPSSLILTPGHRISQDYEGTDGCVRWTHAVTWDLQQEKSMLAGHPWIGTAI